MRDADEAASCPPDMECIEVSPEMTTLIGAGGGRDVPIPDDPLALVVTFTTGGAGALHVHPAPNLADLFAASSADVRLVFLIAKAAIARLGGERLLAAPRRGFHLTSDLRTIALALRDPPAAKETHATYRLAKSIELLCETIRNVASGELVPLAGQGAMSQADSRRIMAVRRLIDERCAEKLTLEGIARACGLNRAKLTRGFKETFDCTVGEAIAARRLAEAGRLLLTTDLLVASVGYEAGYLNNASFARAFGRYFGRSPSQYRAGRLAA